jgi:tetratricopeptide (TPR) repeat protein
MNNYYLKQNFIKLLLKTQKKISLNIIFSLIFLLGLTPVTQGQNLRDQLNITPALNLNLETRNNADQEIALGSQALDRGNRDQAITHWQEALRLYESIADLDGIGKVSNYLGAVYVETGNFVAAENSMRRRLGVTRSRGDQYKKIHALNNLGTLLLEMGRNFQEIEALFMEALETSQGVGDLAGQGLSLSNLGRLAYFQGDYIQAIDFYTSAIKYRGESRDWVGQGNSLNNLGDAYQATLQYWEAIHSYRLAIVTAKSVGNLDNQYRGLEGIAESYGALGFHNRAFTFLNEWGNLAIATGNLRQQLNATSLSAYFYGELKDKENARIFYERAIDLATQLGSEQEIAFLKTQLSQALYTRNPR